MLKHEQHFTDEDLQSRGQPSWCIFCILEVTIGLQTELQGGRVWKQVVISEMTGGRMDGQMEYIHCWSYSIAVW